MPVGGLFLPVTEVAEFSEGSRALIESLVADLVGVSVDLDEATVKQRTALLVGACTPAWLTGTLGVEGSFVYALSDAEISIVGTQAPRASSAESRISRRTPRSLA